MLAAYLKYWSLISIGHPVGLYCAIVCTGVVWVTVSVHFDERVRGDVPRDVANTVILTATIGAFAFWWFAVPLVAYIAVRAAVNVLSSVLCALIRTLDWFVLDPMYRAYKRQAKNRRAKRRRAGQDVIPIAKVISK